MEESIELPVDERGCIPCRGSLEEMGQVETSEEIDAACDMRKNRLNCSQ